MAQASNIGHEGKLGWTWMQAAPALKARMAQRMGWRQRVAVRQRVTLACGADTSWNSSPWPATSVGGGLQLQIQRSSLSAYCLPMKLSGMRGPTQRMRPCVLQAGQSTGSPSRASARPATRLNSLDARTTPLAVVRSPAKM
jgi:hypothetical protein